MSVRTRTFERLAGTAQNALRTRSLPVAVCPTTTVLFGKFERLCLGPDNWASLESCRSFARFRRPYRYQPQQLFRLCGEPPGTANCPADQEARASGTTRRFPDTGVKVPTGKAEHRGPGLPY